MRVVDAELREYAWGRVDGLARWVGATGSPQAEAWFGDADALDGGHPLLVKLLAAANPLSIQVHPKRDAVARLRSTPEGSALLADGAEKNELIYALEPFTALAGFRTADEVADLLTALGVSEAADLARQDDWATLVRALLCLSDVELGQALAKLSDVMHLRLSAPERSAVESARAWYPKDRGVLVALCLQVHELSPGQALYVPAGVVHSYVNGLGVEIMTTSDNVLRLGLTHKAIAVEEALQALQVEQPSGFQLDIHTRFALSNAPFWVERVDLGGGWLGLPAAPTTILAVYGTARVRSGARTLELSEGRAALIDPSDGPVEVESYGRAIVASAV